MVPTKPNLIVGRAYFSCAYYLRKLPIPVIETLIYIGTNIYPEDADDTEHYHYFEDPDHYFAEEISAESAKYHSCAEAGCLSEQCSPQRIRVADSELEGLIYDYGRLKDWVLSLGLEPNADKAF
ncbi:MAG: hypothetical protein HY749_09025 [Gammaproteobacteria bacterium]|nr:hypothetical protein [Gammaproteobacteria bacterium]